MKKSLLLFTVLLVPLDFIMLFLAGLSAYFLRTSDVVAQFRPVLFHLNLPLERYIAILLAVIPFWIVIFALTGLYNIKRKSLLEEFFQIIASASFAMMGVIIYIFMQREWFDSRFIVLAVWLFAVVYVFSGRFILGKIHKTMGFGIGVPRRADTDNLIFTNPHFYQLFLPPVKTGRTELVFRRTV